MFTSSGGHTRVGNHCHGGTRVRGAGSLGVGAADRTGLGWHTGRRGDSRGDRGRRSGAAEVGNPPSVHGVAATADSAYVRHSSRAVGYGHGSCRGSRGHPGEGCRRRAAAEGRGGRSHRAVAGKAASVSETGHGRHGVGNRCATSW